MFGLDNFKNLLPRFSNITVKKRAAVASGLVLAAAFLPAAPIYAQHVMGLDTSSAANTNAPSQALWNTAFANGYQFAFVRSSRGGTSDSTRLDDAHFYDNITRATTAGMLVGSYHYARHDVTTHDGVDDANHYLERAGMYMKPGYLMPVFDLEGADIHTPAQLTAWGIDFIETIYNAKGINPIVYTSSSYNNDEVLAAIAWNNSGSTPKSDPRTYQWVARPGGNGTSGDPPPATNYPNPYGVWDPNFITRTNSRDPAINPWVFWQQTLDTTPAGLFKIDINYANGNMEFVKDFLVPALWVTNGPGDWGTIANWNSDNPTYNGTIQSGPAPRLPNNSSLDWVKLQHPSDGTVTISGGTRTVRKLYTQQPLNITGGSLTVSYSPGIGGKWDIPSEFNDTVTLSTGASYMAHTTQIDGGGGQFTLNGGTVTFRNFNLESHASNPGKIEMNGDVTFVQSGGAGITVIRSTGSLAQPGIVSLTAGNRTFNVNNGSSAVDLNVRVGVTGAGRLVKSGAGTMQLSSANTYGGGTTISNGILNIASDDRLGAVPGGPQSNNIILDGGMLRTGAQINSVSLTNAGSGYTSFPGLSISGAGGESIPASVNLLAGITSIQVANGGSAYVNQSGAGAPPSNGSSGTFVDIIGGGGTGATARATVVGGVITAITIVNPGSGYTSLPTIHISSTISGGGVAGSGAVASVNGIALQGIRLNDGGFDYTNPTINLVGGGGTGATASAVSAPNQTLNSNRGIELTAIGGTLHQTAGTTLTVPGVISSSGNGALTKSGAGTLVLSGANTYTGNTQINSGILQIGSTANLGSASNSIVFNGGTLRFSGGITETRNITLNAGGGTVDSPLVATLSGVISGTGNFTKAGVGPVQLTNDNTYTGTTTISTGSLSIGNGGTTGSLASSSIVNNGSLTFNRGDASTYAGAISGTGTLTKLGAGTLALTGENTYSGTTNVNAGTLLANNASGSATGSGAVNVNASGTLGGTGSVGGTVTLDGGTLAPGNSIENLGVGGNLVITAGTLNFDLGSPVTSDRIDVAGDLTITGGTLNLFDLGGMGAGTYTLIDYAGTLTGSEDNLDINLTPSDDFTYDLVNNETNLSIDLVIEAIAPPIFAGDFNNDGTIDAADYVLWRHNESTDTPLANDPTEGSVDEDDYDTWTAGFGSENGGGADAEGAVPEPSSAWLIIIAVGAGLFVGRRYRPQRAFAVAPIA